MRHMSGAQDTPQRMMGQRKGWGSGWGMGWLDLQWGMQKAEEEVCGNVGAGGKGNKLPSFFCPASNVPLRRSKRPAPLRDCLRTACELLELGAFPDNGLP